MVDTPTGENLTQTIGRKTYKIGLCTERNSISGCAYGNRSQNDIIEEGIYVQPYTSTIYRRP